MTDPEIYEWWRDWRTGAEIFAFMAGCYLLLVIAGCLS